MRDPSDKGRELVFPLSRHSSVFMSDYGVSINGKIEKIHFCIRALVKIKVVFFFSFSEGNDFFLLSIERKNKCI